MGSRRTTCSFLSSNIPPPAHLTHFCLCTRVAICLRKLWHQRWSRHLRLGRAHPDSQTSATLPTTISTSRGLSVGEKPRRSNPHCRSDIPQSSNPSSSGTGMTSLSGTIGITDCPMMTCVRLRPHLRISRVRLPFHHLLLRGLSR